MLVLALQGNVSDWGCVCVVACLCCVGRLVWLFIVCKGMLYEHTIDLLMTCELGLLGNVLGLRKALSGVMLVLWNLLIQKEWGAIFFVWGVIWEHVWGCLIGLASFFANLMCFLYVQFRPFFLGGGLFLRDQLTTSSL